MVTASNDRFVDANGDGVNDVSDLGYVAMPGWVDLDGDGVNDFFRDGDGNGLNDLAGTPMGYGHGFDWADAEAMGPKRLRHAGRLLAGDERGH
jgi:hypothetical protein